MITFTANISCFELQLKQYSLEIPHNSIGNFTDKTKLTLEFQSTVKLLITSCLI